MPTILRIFISTSWWFCTLVFPAVLQAPAEALQAENNEAQLTIADVAITVDIAPEKLTVSHEQVRHRISEAAQANGDLASANQGLWVMWGVRYIEV